ncbi:peptidoglycan DD-metalloendopeptidase family protein [Haliea sp. E17]|uniref:peptidoglycan DD-metalloendopeptidase family protein n=1 Tax=Haliea sp. E17 TaxID=3401576 RepID=UPI003AAAB683
MSSRAQGRGTTLAQALGLALALLQLSGCGSNAPAPVEDRNARGPNPSVATHSSHKTYSVQRGDTLYSIAFRYGLDYRRLAAANGIAAPYTIYPGQRLVLEQADLPARTAQSSSAARPAATPSAAPPASTSRPPASTVTKPSPAPAKTVAQPSPALGPVKGWRWPTSGPVIRGYSATVHKGIDIGGARGDAVVAVAPGQVVYAGTGIVGLGELIIVKHNEHYLSAYGHNEVLLVKEGQNVSSGQSLARKGSSGTDRVKLHFEIRRDGKPIDPTGVLPRR